MHLTYHPDSDLSVAASPANAGEAGAPGHEIKITPEMIEAGIASLFEFDSRFESEEECVTRVFRAMERQSPSKMCPGYSRP